jgi:hypothetical protein
MVPMLLRFSDRYIVVEYAADSEFPVLSKSLPLLSEVVEKPSDRDSAKPSQSHPANIPAH